uniref:Peroxisomal membrane protein PEX14 n=1 Tax=Caenorhabditis japonica TaxID=281687 RepID=A0A8R1EJ05_CAEJA
MSDSPRSDMVEAARKFMLTPKVRETPFEEQRDFLLGKGVTDAEITEARASIPPEMLTRQIGSEAANGGGPQMMMMEPPRQNG